MSCLRTLLLVLCLAPLLNSRTSAQSTATPNISPEPIEVASVNRKMVWVHSKTSFPLELKHILPYVPQDVGLEAYGVNYPLQQELGLEQRLGWGWQTTDIKTAKAAGVDGFAVDVLTGDARSYLQEADKVGGFLIAPCLDLSGVPSDQTEATALRVIEANCKIGQAHPSAARVKTATGENAFLFFTYGTGMVSADGWVRVRAQLAQDGYKVFIVAAVEANGDLTVLKEFPRAVMASYLPPFEAGYTFGNAGRYWDDIVALNHEHDKLFAGGMMPGYFRFGWGYADACGTARYRAEWQRHLLTSPFWTCISTWNDMAENTEILPVADWNSTRTELTRWYSAKFKGQMLNWRQPRLYITTPKAIYPGQASLAEGLVLNPTTQTVSVTVELMDGASKPVGKARTVRVGAGEDNAAVVPLKLNTFPTGRFLRARATLRDGRKVLTSVASAPILVLDESAQPGYRQTLYYSIPAHKALPATVQITLNSNPMSEHTARARPTTSVKVRPRFVEVLHNTALVKNFFSTGPFTTTVPRMQSDGAIAGKTEWGFYLARVTDQNFRVGYSDPIYIAPPMHKQ